MELICVPAFNDNYIWLLATPQGQCIIVDPGECNPVLQKLAERHLTPQAILLTHHHNDHVGGVRGIIEQFPQTQVYGPQETASKGSRIILKNTGIIKIADIDLTFWQTPGHTAGHISYYCQPYLFSGDTLFSAGCGRLFEGTAEQMYQSLQQFAALPDDTLLCCAHEYTLANLQFAESILPNDLNIINQKKIVLQMREKGCSSLPSTLGLERKINLFLRCDDIDLKRKIPENIQNTNPSSIFAYLRQMKDSFKSF
jgi:hydroxyacylglutathione hydrolase